jgi:hypothetical protein
MQYLRLLFGVQKVNAKEEGGKFESCWEKTSAPYIEKDRSVTVAVLFRYKVIDQGLRADRHWLGLLLENKKSKALGIRCLQKEGTSLPTKSLCCAK